MKKYEYRVEVVLIQSKKAILKICNQMGEEGWEAVGLDDGYILFKREKEE
ncbi:DUF4177 domain-containing protein [uncultured Clostridium sp.]|nr:DUF4177 domain-containing protein [uncultured Clostridium sp.]